MYRKKITKGRSGSLKEQYNYYVKRLKERLIKERAFQYAMGYRPEPSPNLFFKNLSFKEVYEKGITRKNDKGKTIRYYGEEAIKIRIQSLKFRASKTLQGELFINNYLSALRDIGMPYNYINEIQVAFSKISLDMLSIIIDRGILPQIAVLYSEIMSYEELKEQIINALKKGVSKIEVKELRKNIKIFEDVARRQITL